MENKKSEITLDAIQIMCQQKTGALDTRFLCQSLSILNPRLPTIVKESIKVRDVHEILKSMKDGCVLIEDSSRQLTGIFSERDMVIKVLPASEEDLDKPISDFMTKDPITAYLDTTVAFALNLMSQGGFRHIPLVDLDGQPVGLVTVRDIMDFLVNSFMQDLMDFPVGAG